MQKVISVDIFSRSGTSIKSITEYNFEGLNKLLEEGYVIVKVYQISPSASTNHVILTFVLNK